MTCTQVIMEAKTLLEDPRVVLAFVSGMVVALVMGIMAAKKWEDL